MNQLSKKAFLALMSSIVVCFVLFSIKDSTSIRKNIKNEPINYSYSFDGLSFLKTFYLMKQGVSFYDANIYAIQHDARQGPPPVFVSGWRLPLTFWVWNVFAREGEGIWFLFLFCSVISLFALFDIAKMTSGQIGVLISSFFLTPYFYFALTSYQFLLIEWWGLFLFIIGLRFLLRGHINFGILFMLVGIFMRELFLISLGAIAIAMVLNSKKINYPFIIFSMVFGIYYFFHYQFASETLGETYHMKLQFFGQRFGSGGFIFLRQTLAYGTNFFITTQFRIQATLLMLMLTIGGYVSSLVKRDLFVKQLPFILVLAVVFVFLLIGAPDNDYWGIVYVPFLPVLFLKIVQDIVFPRKRIS